MTTLVWIDGNLRPATEPAVAVVDHGLTVGDGAFETLEVVDGRAFALARHLVRLEYSATRMGLGVVDLEQVRDGVGTVLAESGDLTRLRIMVTSGPGPMSSARGVGPLTVIVTATDAPALTECRAVRVPWRRNERSPLAGVKSTSYAENVIMVEFARSKGADEALMANTRGELCEGTASNVLVERDGEILTPPLSSGCLAGITRGLALEWGAEEGLKVRAAEPDELRLGIFDDAVAGDAYLAVTSSTRRVQPLAALDGVDLAPGPLLSQLAAIFDARAGRDGDPAPRRSRKPL